MESKRVFIAIDISDKARAAVALYIERLRLDFPRASVGWEKAEKLHFTLRFLGNINEGQLAHVCEIVDAVASAFTSFEVRIAETGVFPHPKEPKILWLGVRQGSDELVAVNAEIEQVLETLGFSRERRKFRAHLTIARIRDPLRSRELVRTHTQRQLEPITFTASGLTVYESELQKAGSVYSVIRLSKFPN